MYSYIALVSKTTRTLPATEKLAQKISSEQPQYSMACKADRVIFMHAGTKTKAINTYLLNAGQGVIVGTLFRRTTNKIGEKVPTSINDLESKPIISTNGRHLIGNYWGRYTAFITNRSTDKTTVLSDPTGVIPSYYCDLGHTLIFFSNFEHFLSLNLTKLTINSEYTDCFLASPQLIYRDTGIREIHQVWRGTALTIGATGKMETNTYWRHRDFCQKGGIKDPIEAADLLRETVTGCIHAWAEEFDKILLTLSGGLDSSIILGCLASAPSRPHITCYNHYTPGEISDEREFARKAAAAADVKLIEVLEDPDEVDFSVINNFPIQPEPRPWRQAIGFGKSQYLAYREAQADVIFTGEGGDAVFYQGSDSIIEDFVWHNGLSSHLFKQAILYGRLKKLSIWSVLRTAMAARLSVEKWDFSAWALPTPSTSPHSISDNIIDTVVSRTRHWVDDLSDLSIAKAQQVASLLLFNHLDRPNGYLKSLPLVQPFYSQPIVELILQLPTYLFSWPGVDRGLARIAFENIIPEEIKTRQSKGSPSAFYKNLSRKYLDYMINQGIDNSADNLFRNLLVKNFLFDHYIGNDELLEKITNIEEAAFNVASLYFWHRKLYFHLSKI